LKVLKQFLSIIKEQGIYSSGTDRFINAQGGFFGPTPSANLIGSEMKQLLK
jgi:hypothetical protein